MRVCGARPEGRLAKPGVARLHHRRCHQAGAAPRCSARRLASHPAGLSTAAIPFGCKAISVRVTTCELRVAIAVQHLFLACGDPEIIKKETEFNTKLAAARKAHKFRALRRIESKIRSMLKCGCVQSS